jgi:hypothetical protein
MPRPARNPTRYSESILWWKCPICPKLCKSKSGGDRHICQKHGNVSSGPVLLEIHNENLPCSSSPDSIQQDIRTPEIEDSPMPPVFTPETPSEPGSILLDRLANPPVSPLLSNFPQEGDYDSEISSAPSCHRQRLTTVGSTTYHPTINGE